MNGPAHDRPDRELAADFAGGDEQAFRALYRRHSPALYAVLRRLLGMPEAEDALQETWLRAARGLRGFRWDSSLRTWLYGMALNVSREAFKRRARQAGDVVEPGALETVAAPRPAHDALRLDLERALERLPDGYRAVLVLHDVWGFTHGEIGGLLGVHEGTSKSQLAAARNAARAWLRRAPPATQGVGA